MNVTVDRKRIMRRMVLGRRGRVAADAREAAGAAAADLLLSLPEAAAASTVMAFASFGTELPTDSLVSRLLATDRRVLMPVVSGGRIRAAAISSLDDLAPGYKGIREPRIAQPQDPIADLIIVPGVAFDMAGHRLGYGGGLYDEILSESAGTAIGLCLDCQIVDEVPVEPHDRPVAAVVTEARVLRPSPTN